METGDQITAEKATLALKDLAQAWAYSTPVPLAPVAEEEPVQGYALYCKAA